MPPELELSVDRRSDLPLGAQLAARIRNAMADRTLAPGDRLPSVRELATAAGVNVNTARSVYARLESEGLVRSEHGRGTFVGPGSGGEAATRRELRRQIAQLEAALVRLPPPPLPATDTGRPSAHAALLSTEDLEGVRDRLLARLDELDSQRAEVLESLEQLGLEEAAAESEPPASRRASPSLAGARIRWVGA